jgi:hypothetical protein
MRGGKFLDKLVPGLAYLGLVEARTRVVSAPSEGSSLGSREEKDTVPPKKGVVGWERYDSYEKGESTVNWRYGLGELKVMYGIAPMYGRGGCGKTR